MVSVGVAGAHVQPVLEKFYSLLAAGLWLLAAGLVVFGTWYLVFPHSVSKEIAGSAIQVPTTKYQIPAAGAAGSQKPEARSPL